MERSLIKRLAHSTMWIPLGIGLLVIAGGLLVVAFLNPGIGITAPEQTAMLSPIATETSTIPLADTATAQPTPASEPSSAAEPGSAAEPLAASVNGYTITQSYLSKTVALNKVLGELSGASTLGEKETLQRLVRSQLILQGVRSIEEPAEEDVEGFIAALESNWGVSQQEVDQKLQEAGVDRAFLEDTISRLLTVQAGVDRLEEEGHDISDWLREQEQDAQIMIFEDLASVDEREGGPDSEAPDQPESPTPRSQPGAVAVAPSFTLNRAGGGSFSLDDQLKEKPVVLVFFEKCG